MIATARTYAKPVAADTLIAGDVVAFVRHSFGLPVVQADGRYEVEGDHMTRIGRARLQAGDGRMDLQSASPGWRRAVEADRPFYLAYRARTGEIITDAVVEAARP